MLFMVASSPRPEAPSTVRHGQHAFWSWLDECRDSGTVRNAWCKVGRGVVVVVDVASHEALHALLTRWCEFIPASFDIQPLMPTDVQRGIAASATRASDA